MPEIAGMHDEFERSDGAQSVAAQRQAVAETCLSPQALTAAFPIFPASDCCDLADHKDCCGCEGGHSIHCCVDGYI